MSKKNPEKFQQKQIKDKKMKRKKKLEKDRKNYILLSVSCTIQIKCTYIIMPPLLEHSVVEPTKHRFNQKKLM